ncbi:MAG: hypothetical protein ABSB32_02145 [Thermodesulfobacteriota bacterium]
MKKDSAYVYERSDFSWRKFQETGFEPGDLKSLDDVAKAIHRRVSLCGSRRAEKFILRSRTL